MTSLPSVTSLLAIYGAVLSTFAIVRQFIGERVKVKVTVRRNMKPKGEAQYDGKDLVILTVTNVGRRPVTIKTIIAIGLYPHDNLLARDTRPQVPYELTEGRFIVSFWDQTFLDFSRIDRWEVWDSHDHLHQVPEASRFKHWKSVFQRKLALG